MKCKAGILLYKMGADEIEVLIVRNGKGNWSIPKGNIEEGESRLRAAKRELLEEVAILAPATLSYLGRVRDDKRDAFLSCYVGRVPKYVKPRSGDGIVEAKFMSIADALEIVEPYQIPFFKQMQKVFATVA